MMKTIFDLNVSGVAIDSRNVLPGQLFFALKGERVDGHDFLKEVALKGAVGAVVRSNYNGPDFGLKLIRVEDTLLALQEEGKKRIAQSSGKIAAITGSVGKTTTKGFLATLLKQNHKVSSSKASQNSQAGLSLSILNEVQGDEDFLVLEMGMTGFGHIERLVEIAPPDIALVTTIALVHAEYVDSLSQIARAKSEIFLRDRTKIGIVNFDTPCTDILMQSGRCEKLGYSVLGHPDATWKLLESEKNLVIEERGKKVTLRPVQFMAKHLYANLLGAIGVARSFGLSWDEIEASFSQLQLPERRLEPMEKKGIHFINDAYNASEISMKAALDVMKNKKTDGRKIAILGQMRELGKFSVSCHKNVGEAALNSVDRMICFGVECKPIVDVWKSANKPIEWFLEFDDLAKFLQKELQAGDSVLVKGSRSNQLERVFALYGEEK